MIRVALDGTRILVIVYGHVADTMAAIPGLRTLRRSYPSARIEVLVLQASAPILAHSPYVDELLTWGDLRRKGTRLARIEKASAVASLTVRLRRRRYDTVVVFHRSFGFLRKLAHAVGARTVVTAPAIAETESSRDENRRVLAALGLQDDGEPVELWNTPAESRVAQELLGPSREQPTIGLHPGSDWSCQQWLPESFAAVGRRLQLSLGARLVITGTAGEERLQEEIADGLHEAPVRAAGKTTLGELTEVIRRLDLLICVNSAAAAIARAVGTPAVVLLGAEDPRLTGLDDDDSVRIVQGPPSVAPGSWCEFGRWGLLSSCESPMCRGLGGLAEVSSDRVYAAATDLLGATPGAVDLARRFPQEVAT
ncbi:MAG TPA: glycosyltransferase family 9 protein [Candidatus Dormibacteraeota bacterium]|nr:glycosyltransferase family 9 protein [Candidatus Dormibacteraeota bacterium]